MQYTNRKVIENVSPKVTGGKHKVIDEILTTADSTKRNTNARRQIQTQDFVLTLPSHHTNGIREVVYHLSPTHPGRIYSL
jgi:hypothetical protein